MIDRPLISILLIIMPMIALVGVEYLGKRFNFPREITRKIIHIVLGLVAILGFIEGPTWLFAIIVAILTLLMIISFHKKLLPSVHDVKRPTYGEVFLPIGILLPLIIVAEVPNIYITSILTVTLADGGAGIVGYLLHKKGKSIIGSIVFLVIAGMIILLCNSLSPISVLAIALGATIIERFSPYGTDNLTIPIGVSGLMLLFHM